MQTQKGMTFIGLVLMVAGIVFIAVIGMKLAPSYIEFAAIKNAIAKLPKNPGYTEWSVKEIKTAFQKSAEIDNIEQVTENDLVITPKESGGSAVEVEYQVVVPLVANVSALLDFKASTEH